MGGTAVSTAAVSGYHDRLVKWCRRALCCALGIPWLPQTLLVPVRRPRTHPDDIGYVVEAQRPGTGAITGEPRLVTAPDARPQPGPPDVSGDGVFPREAAYPRCHLPTIHRGDPAAGRHAAALGMSFPGLPHVLPSSIFQLGGLGGLPAEEYLSGSARVAAFAAHGSHYQRWEAPAPDGERPRQSGALRRNCVRRLRAWHSARDIASSAWVFSTHTISAPLSPISTAGGIASGDCQRSGFWESLLPCSIRGGPCTPVGTVLDLLRGAAGSGATGHYLRTTDPYDDIYLTLFSHGIESIGIAPIAAGVRCWRTPGGTVVFSVSTRRPSRAILRCLSATTPPCDGCWLLPHRRRRCR